MKIHDGHLGDVDRYIEHQKHISLADKRAEFDSIMWWLGGFTRIDSTKDILEIGTGIGWIPAMCAKKGLRCKGIEISPQLVEYGKAFGKRHGVDVDIELGNIEDADLGHCRYDVVIATSAFEHVENWRKGFGNVYDALKPGGVLYFYSTNKFALISGEFRFPLYGWLPNRWRYALRRAAQGEDIMRLGIDFNQFTYPQLRRTFRGLGFTSVFDMFEILDPSRLRSRRPAKIMAIRMLRSSKLLRAVALTFVPGTFFICIK